MPHDSRQAAARPASLIAALGVVYGDLGTSPLYTLQTIMGSTGGHSSPADALGILSLLVWALIIIISVKYGLVVMRADNNGEGGILALMSLIGGGRAGRLRLLTAMGLFGAALIYGDGIITPAISVLSAVEGVNVATDALKPYIMPIGAVILFALFAVQRFGTTRIGRAFGPLMLVWFTVIAAIGAWHVAHHPGVLVALDPLHALRFLAGHGWKSLVVLGGVFLAVTGGEALYADMGHIGRPPIRMAWYCLVLPALLLSYAGQTAILIDNPNLQGNPFFHTVPGWALYPMVGLATCATVIASQAIITGAFSLTRQGMQLGFLPGLTVRQTSKQEYGQIYVPFVNWTMMVLTIALAVAFGSSDRLSGAYGTAVSTTMLLTTALLYRAMRTCWKWPTIVAAFTAGVFLIVDVTFFSANLLKIADGGWVPLLLGVIIYLVMTSWRQGIAAMQRRIGESEETPEQFLGRLANGLVPRLRGTAVFLTRTDKPLSQVIIRVVEHFGALQQSVVSMSVRFEDVPRVPRDSCVEVSRITEGFWHVRVHFGFTDTPSLPAALAIAAEQGCALDLGEAVWFATHDEIVPARRDRLLSAWRRMLFAFMYRNAVHMADRFALPTDRFLELGRQIEL